MPITPGQAFLSLPAGLTEADYPVSDNLLDYTPPDVRWQPPLATTGSNIFANYVKAHPDLLREYNRKLARPMGESGALPENVYGAPLTMAEYGYKHWGDHGQAEGRTLTQPTVPWGDPGRSPHIAYYYPGPFRDIPEDASEEDTELLNALNTAIASAGGSQTITPSDTIIPDTGGDTTQTQGNQTPQQIVDQAIEDDPSLGIHPNINQGMGVPTETEYPSGHNTYQGWYMDPANKTGHYWALSMRDPTLEWSFSLGRYKRNGVAIY